MVTQMANNRSDISILLLALRFLKTQERNNLIQHRNNINRNTIKRVNRNKLVIDFRRIN